MELIQVKTVLHNNELQNPQLNVLIPDNQTYSCFLLQPAGPIFADNNRIGNLDSDAASTKFKLYLDKALEKKIDLVISPEYSVPWCVIRELVEKEHFPDVGKLWVLGCESITVEELSALGDSPTSNCKIIKEELTGNGKYCDPIAYCFKAKNNSGQLCNVIILQFKTTPSRDPIFLENENLICGKSIYSFRNDEEGLIALSSIICSDSLWLESNPQFLNTLIDRSILIHIQLNPSPRHNAYKAYRGHVFLKSQDLSNCDLICLNWAQSIVQHSDISGKVDEWKNIAGSTWYLPKSRCATQDSEVLRNHLNGLYYSYMYEDHRHALLFHYDAAIFHLNATKPVANVPEVQINRHGPKMVKRLLWNDLTSLWVDTEEVDSGLNEQLNTDENIKAALEYCSNNYDPLAMERAVAIGCGLSKNIDLWYKIEHIESCQIASNEIVRRLTFTQDTDQSARDYRHRKYMLSADLGNMLINYTLWPPQIKDIQGAKIKWESVDPNSNVYKDGVEAALVINFGADPELEKIKSIAQGMLELRRRRDPNKAHRIAAFYRSFGQVKFVEFPDLIRIDSPGESLKSITDPLGEY